MSAAIALGRRAAFWLRGSVGRRRAGWVALAAFLVTAVAGLGLALGRVAVRGGQGSGASGALVLYLQVGTEPGVGRALADEVARLGGVSGVEYVEPDQTLARLRLALAGDEELLEGVDLAAMPPSIEASLMPGIEEVLPLSGTLAALRRHPAIAQVALEQAPRDELAHALGRAAPWALRLQLLAGALATLLGLALVRLGWRAPRRELAVVSLLGGTPSFFVLPAALAAALAAALGALAGAWTALLGAGALAGALLGAATAPLATGAELALIGIAAVVGAAFAAAFAVLARQEEP